MLLAAVHEYKRAVRAPYFVSPQFEVKRLCAERGKMVARLTQSLTLSQPLLDHFVGEVEQ
jgi:hypothetical protein